MSYGRLANPLDGFASYSTHFVLLACRTTERARLFSDESKNTETLEAINRCTHLGQAVPYGGSSDVFLVLDTRRFSQFTVERLEYEVLINGLQKGEGHGNLATEVQMTVLDSIGISFMNYMQWLMDSQMQTNFDGMIFMLRLIFVGHNADGTDSKPVQTVSIPMHLFKMEVNLDYAKGAYACTFMPNFNFSVNQHNRWLNIGSATTFSSPPGSTKLGDMVQALENALNDRSAKFYEDMSALLIRGGRAPAKSTGKVGRKVQYQITLPDGGTDGTGTNWNEFIYTGPGTGNALELDYKERFARQGETPAAGGSSKAETQARQTTLSVEPGQTITEVLDIMFKQTAQVQELANAEKLKSTDKFVTFYKHLVSISSNEDSFTVHVDVIPFEVPNVVPPKPDTATKVSQNQAQFLGQDGKPINYFELDYIFTGKNLDILNMDMKIQDLQFLLAANVKVGEGEIFSVSNSGQGELTGQEKEVQQKVNEMLALRQYDPVVIPKMTAEELTNFNNMINARRPEVGKQQRADRQNYTRNLSAFYASSPVMTQITIKGNPAIMAKFNIPHPVPHVTASSQGAAGQSRVDQSVKQKYRQQLTQEILKTGISQNSNGTFQVQRPLGDASYTTSPVFVLINIMGPNVDFTTNELIDGQNFATRVLFDNYYVVFKIKNVIDRGTFTQDLELWSHNVYGVNKLTAEQLNKSPLAAPVSTTTRTP